MNRVRSFLTHLGSRDPGGGWRPRLAEAGLPGLEQMPAPWSVLGGQAGHEEQLRTKHLPSLEPWRPVAGASQNVGPLSAFCTDWHLVLS